MNNLVQLLEETMPYLKYDLDLYKKIRTFKINWASKSDEYIDFLGSGLTGVHKVRFSTRDEDLFFGDILGLDLKTLQVKIYKIPGINKAFKVSSDVNNIILLWLMHKFYLSPEIKENLKSSVVTDIYHIFAYKVIGSLFSKFFPHQIDPSIAQTVFEDLSDKFLIKKLGSWELVIDHSAKVLLPGGIRHKELIKFQVQDVISCLNDMQTRLRATVRNVANVTYGYIYAADDEKEKKIQSTSLIGKGEEGEVIKDITQSSNRYVESIRFSIMSPNDFVKDELIKLICKVIPNAKFDFLKETLQYLSINCPMIKTGEVDYIYISIKQSLAYLQAKGIDHGFNQRAYECLMLLKKYYSASKVRIPDVLNCKKRLDKDVKNALIGRKGWVSAPIVIGVILYIFIRAIYNFK